jgi:TnpA family transposase
MASIDRTAYPRFKRGVSVRELGQAYSPSLDEMEWARGLTDTDDHLLSLVVWLKCCQRLGYFPKLAEIPVQVVGHVRDELGLHEDTRIAKVAERSLRHHKSLVRTRLGLVDDQGHARKVAEEAIRGAAQAKDNPADLINVALDELVKSGCELPAFSTLDRMAGDIRAEVNGGFFGLIHSRMGVDDHARMLGMVRVDPVTRRSGHDRAKKTAGRATVSHLREHLDHLAWLDGMGGSTDAWVADVPAAKIRHFAAEARALDASEMGDFGQVKRIVLEACLLHQARIRARDDLVTMLCKRMNTLHNKAKELLEKIREEQRERNERMLSVFGEMLTAAHDVDMAARAADKPWSRVRKVHQTGKVLLAAIEANGGLAGLLAEHEALVAHHSNNYLPLLDRFYRSHRSLLLRLTAVLVLEPTSTDRRLLDALDFVLANQNRTAEYISDSHTVTDTETGQQVSRVLDTSFAPEAWQKVIRDRRRPGKLVRRHLEICVFSCLADELVRGDVAAVGSETYATWQSQLLSWEECEPLVAGYCAEVGLPTAASEFRRELQSAMGALASSVDQGYPDNADLSLDEDGRPVLTAGKGNQRSASALALQTAIRERLPERSLLDILIRTTRWLRWYRYFGPLSGSDPKLADPLERYLLVAFTYGCNLGAAQAARHLRGLVSAHELSWTVRRHVTLEQLNKAITEVVNAYLALDLPKIWGDASSVSADGTKYDIYVDNLVAEYHIRYGGYGGIAYHHIADNYIALFSRFVPCGVWEAVYIIEGLLAQESDATPREIHADTQGQSFPVFGLAYLFGFELLPRIRNFKDMIFHRPTAGVRYAHIDALFSDPINWRLIEEHWKDLMRVVISIREGRLSSVTLLRRLRHDSKKNKIYRAFRELGRAVRTMVLLRYISQPSLRKHIGRATNMVESFNRFSKWLNFGNHGVIAENDPEEQEKAIKFNTLVADLVMFNTAIDMSTVINQLQAQGHPASRADLATMAPYQQDNVRRFGDFAYDLTTPLEPMDVHLALHEDTDAA